MTKIVGDPHLGRRFNNNVPLHRRGDHEKIVWTKFREGLDPKGAKTHVNMGDIFDRAVVPYIDVWRAAHFYRCAARIHRDTTFIVLRGNHDASRDLEAVSAFDIFAGLVGGDNIIVVKDWLNYDGLAFFGWHPITSAEALVEDFIYNTPNTRGMTAFGHWDVDPLSDPFNLIPTEQLAAAGITKAYTGHVHTARRVHARWG